MSEKHNYSKPLTDKEIHAKAATLGPYRKHGEMPPKAPKPMVKDRIVPVRTPEQSRRSVKRLGAAITVGLLALAAMSSIKDNGVEGDGVPTVTTTVGAESDGVWGAAQRELADAGYARDDGSVPNKMTRDLVDQAMELNEAANPSFDALNLVPGQPIILPDVPHKQEK